MIDIWVLKVAQVTPDDGLGVFYTHSLKRQNFW